MAKKWLNETNIKDQLKHSIFAAVTLQYSSELRKQKQDLQDCVNHQPSRRFLEEDFPMQIIIDCSTTQAVDFETKLGFKQHDPIMNQEQSILLKNAIEKELGTRINPAKTDLNIFVKIGKIQN